MRDYLLAVWVASLVSFTGRSKVFARVRWAAPEPWKRTNTISVKIKINNNQGNLYRTWKPGRWKQKLQTKEVETESGVKRYEQRTRPGN